MLGPASNARRTQPPRRGEGATRERFRGQAHIARESFMDQEASTRPPARARQPRQSHHAVRDETDAEDASESKDC
eukprot:7925307-Pyramimonas_sp.AAC.1